MWSAFMNSAGLHGGGGAGGGYVPSQGWEFIPCSGVERAGRGRGHNRSPLRRISSPPAVFSQIYESYLDASPGGTEGGVRTQTESPGGQMWPGPEQQQQQQQHARLKKKFEDLKKRHVQDKEEWMREKESLLREVADIQGGENRRILLDLKTILDEVQAEVKREEEKRSELQLQYTRDRCAWELEKAELKCRIAQLEAREAPGLVGGGVQSNPGVASVASCSPPERRGETSAFCREREEQQRILVDTYSTAMDLRCRLEHSERDWLREKAELLERFDVERREWENQLRDMQRKIEELYCEVRAKRAGSGLDDRRRDADDAAAHRLSVRSTSTGSSLLSENSHSEALSSSSQSEPNRHPPLPGFRHNRGIGGEGGCANTDTHHPTCFQEDSLCEFRADGQYTRHNRSQLELLDEFRSIGTLQQDSVTSKGEVDTAELDAIFQGAAGCGLSQQNPHGNSDHTNSQESSLWAGLSFGSGKKRNTTALNAALKEIARVSEELCSYQDEIKKKSGDQSNRCESHDKTHLVADEAPCDLNQIYEDLRALERENWITLSSDNTWQANKGLRESWTTKNTDPDSYLGMQTSHALHLEMDPEAPPIPPRTSSWNLSSPTHPDTELHIPETPVATMKKCHSPCVLVDRKCSSPSIVRKFEAMLQENEGKVFVDGGVALCSVPANPNCNTGCCHNRWSCDAGKLTSSKLSTYGAVQKSFSEVNIRSAAKDLRSSYSHGVGNLKIPEIQMPLSLRELPAELLLSPMETPPVSPNLQGFRRNIMLEQKTAEFNRTLFQAEMGRGVEEHDCVTVTDPISVGCQPVLTTITSDKVVPPEETALQSHGTDATTSIVGVHPEVTLSHSISDSKIPSPEVQTRQTRCSTPVQEGGIKKEPPSVLSPEKPRSTVPSHSSVSRSEVKHRVRTASSPSRKAQYRAATEAPSSEPVLPANTQPSQSLDDPSSKKESSHGTKSQPSRAGVSLQQLPAESKQRQTTQPRHMSVPPHQSDSSRPGLRMMNDHPWKPLTLAAYPRPEGSRSNYGALERILKNYESAAREQQNQQKEMHVSPNFSARQEEKGTELDMLNVDSAPFSPTLSHAQSSHSVHAQLSSHSTMCVKEMQPIAQGQEDN
ncbi:protein SOGA3a isoform 2-T2 [Pholidichthys leucotaenia]